MESKNMTVKKESKPETAYRVKNAGEFIMLFPKGNAFLYPGAECVVTEPVTQEQLQRWKDVGCVVTELSMTEAENLSSGVLGIK